MSAVKLDITVEQGVTYKQSLIWQDEFGVALDLTNFTARMQIRHKLESVAPLVSLTELAGITLGGVAGTIDIVIVSDVTNAIENKKGVYDLELVSAAGEVTRLIEGNVTFILGVTR